MSHILYSIVIQTGYLYAMLNSIFLNERGIEILYDFQFVCHRKTYIQLKAIFIGEITLFSIKMN